MISACCDSGAAVCTNTWLSFVGRYNWGWRGVDTSSCLQGWNKDLTPAAVRRRHQLGLEPEKMSFTSSINAAILSPSQPQVSFTFLHSPELFLQLFILLYSSKLFSLSLLLLSSRHPSSASDRVPLSIPPSLLPLALPPPTCKSFPVTQHWFSANFSSLLEVSVAQ